MVMLPALFGERGMSGQPVAYQEICGIWVALVVVWGLLSRPKAFSLDTL